ncbi:hypothetical protein WMY93_014853 [Mugilogobius chulae]|uniref:Equilibrative nucleoside transporter 2 n=1 Tax=Mugilogobius chulae TaxID=88201 RepID=A0AAW0NWP6_9GOBI
MGPQPPPSALPHSPFLPASGSPARALCTSFSHYQGHTAVPPGFLRVLWFSPTTKNMSNVPPSPSPGLQMEISCKLQPGTPRHPTPRPLRHSPAASLPFTSSLIFYGPSPLPRGCLLSSRGHYEFPVTKSIALYRPPRPRRASYICMMGRTDTPQDRGCLVGIIFFILGLGTLLPWNFFMTASLYFQGRLNPTIQSQWSNETMSDQTISNETVSNRTMSVRKEYYFNNWMTLLSQLPLLLFTLLNSFLYQRISEMVRIAGSLVFILLLFLLTAVLVKVPMEEDRFFSVTMATIWFINSFGAVLQGSLFGLVGLLPQKYSAIFMSGQGLAGTFAAVAMLLAIASDTDSETSALGYFITPCVGTLLTLFSYLFLPRLKFAQFYLDRSSKYEAGTTDELLKENKPVENGKLNGHTNGSVPNSTAEKGDGPGEMELESGSDKSKQAFLSLEPEEQRQEKSSVIEVFKKIWVMAFCVTFVFTVTLSVFPAVTADVKTVYEGKWESYFIAVCCFLIFNINDWIGRTITTLFQWPRKESPLFPVLVVCRVVFVPLLMLCNVQDRHYLPVYFQNDAVFTVIMSLFSVTSGYFVCLSMSYAPQMVQPKDAETAGALMTFFLALGLSIGAALSFPLRALV